MDSQLNETSITAEKFRSCFPDVSIIPHQADKPNPRVTSGVDKHISVKASTPVKTAFVPKNTTKPPVKTLSPKTQAVGVKTILSTKGNIPPVIKNQVVVKPPAMVKNPAVTKTSLAKNYGVTKTPVPIKNPVHAAPIPVTNKSPQAAMKTAAVKTPAQLLKLTQTKTAAVKVPQNVIKQQTPNVMKASMKPATTTTLAPMKEDSHDHTSMTVTYHMPQTTPQRPSNQITIEKIEQEQRIPVVLDSNNQFVLQQVINNGHVVLQNRVAPAETSLQSVVIGTTAQTVAPVVPQVKITTSEPLQGFQVTQQVTLFNPKGNTIPMEEVKKQMSLNKQNTMTNVVSSTTNSIPVPVPTQSVQLEQKVPFPGRVQTEAQSPIRQSVRVNPSLRPQQKPVTTQHYQSTRGQVKKVMTQKREIPMQKVSPMQPSPLPPPDLTLANEEEVTTSDTPQAVSTTVIVILPSGERKALSIDPNVNINCTLQELLKDMVVLPDNVNNITAEIRDSSEHVIFQDSEAQWDNTEHITPEPGEILGLHDDLETGELDSESSEQRVQSEAEETNKEADTVNNEPLYREGLLAVCKFCGYTSVDFNHCQRCNRSLSPNCKTISAEFTQKSRKTKADSVTGGNPKKKRICRKKRLEEPVCLTISDDEELLGLAHHSQLNEENFHSDSNSQLSSCDKEPVITDEMVTEMKHSVTGGRLDMEELLDNPNADEKTYLQCRTVRIGSYKVVPRDKVLITPHGLKVTVPVLNSDQFVELKIMYHEIIKVLIHFGRQMPVLFFYTRPSAAAKIRKALRMDDKNGFYYDSTSPDETHRRITFLPDKIDEDCKQTLKNIFGDPENNVFAELTGKEANDILVKASPKEVQAFILKKQPNSINNSPQPPQLQPFDGQNIQTIMVYPPPPEKGGIPINTEDYACLGEDQFLNDVIIDFYLKYVVEKTLSPEDRARTHVFSSFFYKRLTTKPPPKRKSMNPIENDPTASPARKRHSRVKSWTKNVNLFTKDFIVIPINENSHWFLAIICFPGLTGPVRFADNTPIELPGRKKKKVDDKKAAVGVLSGKRTVTIGSTTITSVVPTPTLVDVADEGEDRDEADGEDEDMDVPDSDEDPVQKQTVPDIKEEPEDDQPAKKKQREPIKQPCILIFDSLAGASRSRVVATLRDYLRVEYEVKHGEGRDFSGEVMKGTNLRCPQQTNYTDCGLYVLQYVEAFFQWPITDYHIPIKQLQDWFQADIVSRKRYEIQQLLHHLMQEQNIDLEALNLPLLNLRPEGKHLVEYSGTEEEEDDEDEEEEEQMCEDEDEDMLDDDGDFNDEMERENEDMEEGEISHHADDPDHFMDPNMEHEGHEMDEDEYGVGEEEEVDEELSEDLEEKELEDISLTPIGPVKRKEELKKYRIPRLIRSENMTDNVYKEN